MDNVNDWLDYMNESLTCEERRIVTEHLAEQRQEQYVERIAELEAELAKSHDEAADWRRMYTEQVAELGQWREMERMIAVLQSMEPTCLEINLYHDGEWACDIEHEDTSTALKGYWKTAGEGKGATLPEAVKAAYEEVVKDGE